MGNGIARPRIEIKTKSGTSGVFTEIFIDGHKLRGVRSWKLKSGRYNCIPILTMDLNALDLSVDGEIITRQKGYGEIGISFKDLEGE